MPAPYSYDLRCRVIAHYEKHKNINEIIRVFGVSYSIIYDWIRLKRETGDLKPKIEYQKGHSHKIPDLLVLNNLIDNNSNLTLFDMMEKLGNNMSIMTISRGLKKLNLTNKKKHMATKNEMKKNVTRF